MFHVEHLMRNRLHQTLKIFFINPSNKVLAAEIIQIRNNLPSMLIVKLSRQIIQKEKARFPRMFSIVTGLRQLKRVHQQLYLPSREMISGSLTIDFNSYIRSVRAVTCGLCAYITTMISGVNIGQRALLIPAAVVLRETCPKPSNALTA